MSLKNKINDDLKRAMKSGDSLTRDVLRMLKAQVLEEEVALRAKRGRDYLLTDAEVQAVISRYAKQRHQSISAYRDGGRQDLVENEERELAVLEPYLPQQLGDSELEQIVTEAIEECGATTLRDMGQVMKAAMARAEGRAEGKRVNALVRRLLSG